MNEQLYAWVSADHVQAAHKLLRREDMQVSAEATRSLARLACCEKEHQEEVFE